MTARARSRRSAPPPFATESTNGCVSRPFPDTLSRPCRVIAATRAAGLDDGRHFRGCGKGLQIGVVEIAAGREGVRRRLLPAVPQEQRARRTVDVVSPRREQPDMAPVGAVRRDRRARLVDLHRNAALDEVRRGREADRAGADDGNGRSRMSVFMTVSFRFGGDPKSSAQATLDVLAQEFQDRASVAHRQLLSILPLLPP